MVILRTFLALVSGFATVVLLDAVLTEVLRRLAPDWTTEGEKLGPAPMSARLGSSFLSGAAGGYVTAWLASSNPLVHVLVLGIVVLGLTGLNALQMRGKQPVRYALAVVALTPLGVLTGGLVWLRVTGIL